VPSAALAAPVDVASDHVALRAFDRYVKAELLNVPAGQRADDAFVSSISSGCHGVLTPLASLPSGAFNTSAVTAFFEEAGGDLALAADVPNLVPLRHLSKALSKLRWSSVRTKATVARAASAERTLFSLAPSDLCADARALAANPEAVPPGTVQWLATVGGDGSADKAAFTAFFKVLGRFLRPGDARVSKDIASVSRQFGAARQNLQRAEAQKLLAALGLS
jgi:hypothetical protein